MDRGWALTISKQWICSDFRCFEDFSRGVPKTREGRWGSLFWKWGKKCDTWVCGLLADPQLLGLRLASLWVQYFRLSDLHQEFPIVPLWHLRNRLRKGLPCAGYHPFGLPNIAFNSLHRGDWTQCQPSSCTHHRSCHFNLGLPFLSGYVLYRTIFHILAGAYNWDTCSVYRSHWLHNCCRQILGTLLHAGHQYNPIDLLPHSILLVLNWHLVNLERDH